MHRPSPCLDCESISRGRALYEAALKNRTDGKRGLVFPVLAVLFLALFFCAGHTATINGKAVAVADADTITTRPALDYHPVRSSAARTAFMKANPCPANGKRRGACPGYMVDYVVPLCGGGADHHGNMQWQTRADARIKVREERRQCAAISTKTAK